MASLHDTRAQQLLAVLREAGDEPISLATLKALGIDQPGQTIYELELAGHLIERVYARDKRHPGLMGIRLRQPPQSQPPLPRRSRRRGFRGAA